MVEVVGVVGVDWLIGTGEITWAVWEIELIWIIGVVRGVSIVEIEVVKLGGRTVTWTVWEAKVVWVIEEVGVDWVIGTGEVTWTVWEIELIWVIGVVGIVTGIKLEDSSIDVDGRGGFSIEGSKVGVGRMWETIVSFTKAVNCCRKAKSFPKRFIISI